MAEKKLLGKLPPEAVRARTLPRLPANVIDGFKALADLTGTISDAFDELGIVGVIPAYLLPPVITGARVVGPALTVRNIAHATQIHKAAHDKASGQCETEAHNLAQQGDVLVIQGVANMSNMGGISAQTGKRQGEVGAIVEGGVRDIAHSRSLGYPIWASEITPVTGKWRLETVEINGAIQIGEVRVAAGDLVVADDTGVCFIPRDVVLEVLDAAEAKAKAEEVRCKAIDDGIPVPDISRATYGEK